jgi:hypothetical protein
VLFAERAVVKKNLPAAGLKGKTFTGRVPAHNCNWKAAENKLTEESVTWHYIKQGKATAFSTRKAKGSNKINPYKKEFKQGATIVPRTFYFVELTQETPPDFEDRIINIKTADAKAPWKGLSFSGKIESQFLFRTALSKSILPFLLHEPDFVILPITINKKNKQKTVAIHTAKELMKQGYLNASKWFANVERHWDIQKTEKSKSMSANDRINYQQGITNQNLDANFLVLYNSSAKDANALVVSRSDFDLEFIVESVTYVYYTNNINEAYYLSAIFNSTAPNERMKDFQARGLFGARHVHKKILDIYYPVYDVNNKTHIRLAALSEVCHQKAKKYLQDNVPKQQVSGILLGNLRLTIKKHLAAEMVEIDKLVGKIIE